MPTDPKEKAADAAANAGFDLAGLAAAAVESKPELKTNIEQEGIVLPEEQEGGATGPGEGQQSNDGATGATGPEVGDEGEPGEAGEAGDEGTAADIQRKQDEAAEEKRIADEKKAADDKKAADEAAKNSPTATRDADLKVDGDDPHMRPKTRKVIEERNAKIIEARNARDTAAKEKETLAQQVKDLQAKVDAAAAAKLPEAVEQELTQLRQTVRELDASRDPAIKTKYDSVIDTNRKSVIAILKDDFGLGKDKDGKDDLSAINAITKAGVSLASVAPYLKKMEEGGFVNEAEGIRETIRENIRLERARTAEITEAAKNGDQRRQQVQAQTEEQQKLTTEVTSKALQSELKAGVDEYNKQYPYMHDPEPVKDGDSPATITAKNAAIADFKTATDKVKAECAALNWTGKPPEVAAELQGKVQANAVQHIMLKNYVFPRLLKEATASAARIKELEAEVAKFKKAGSTNRAHISAAAAPAAGGDAAKLPAGVGEGLAAFAASKGINTGS